MVYFRFIVQILEIIVKVDAKPQERLKNAQGEISYAQERGGANFDLVIVNDDLAESSACSFHR